MLSAIYKAGQGEDHQLLLVPVTAGFELQAQATPLAGTFAIGIALNNS
jgi:hypothetical protein